MTDAILVINAGSSSVKFSVFSHDGASAGGDADLALIARGQVEGISRTTR